MDINSVKNVLTSDTSKQVSKTFLMYTAAGAGMMVGTFGPMLAVGAVSEFRQKRALKKIEKEVNDIKANHQE